MNYLLLVFVLIGPSSAEYGWIECGLENEFKITAGEDSWIYGGFDEAQQLCGEEGGELAILKDPDVAQCVMSSGSTFQVILLGLVPNSNSTKGFAWTDGTLVENGYQNWIDGEPENEGILDCAIIADNSKQWKDYSCEARKHYACQRSTGSSTEASGDEVSTNKPGSSKTTITSQTVDQRTRANNTNPEGPGVSGGSDDQTIVIVVAVVVPVLVIVFGAFFCWKYKTNLLEWIIAFLAKIYVNYPTTNFEGEENAEFSSDEDESDDNYTMGEDCFKMTSFNHTESNDNLSNRSTSSFREYMSIKRPDNHEVNGMSDQPTSDYGYSNAAYSVFNLENKKKSETQNNGDAYSVVWKNNEKISATCPPDENNESEYSVVGDVYTAVQKKMKPENQSNTTMEDLSSTNIYSTIDR